MTATTFTFPRGWAWLRFLPAEERVDGSAEEPRGPRNPVEYDIWFIGPLPRKHLGGWRWRTFQHPLFHSAFYYCCNIYSCWLTFLPPRVRPRPRVCFGAGGGCCGCYRCNIGEGSRCGGHHLHHQSPGPGRVGRAPLLRADPRPLARGPIAIDQRVSDSCQPRRAGPRPTLGWQAAAWAGAGGAPRGCEGACTRVCTCACVWVCQNGPLSPAPLPRQRSPAPGGWWLSAQAD